MLVVASIRNRTRKDGSTYYAVLFRFGGRGGRQSSLSFEDEASANKFRALVEAVGPAKAMEVCGVVDTPQRALSGYTVSEWLDRYIGNLTGVEKKTITEYKRYADRDIGTTLGPVPLSKLTRNDVTGWVNAMQDAGASGKTISNKHGLLSAALKQAAEAGHIPANPCHGVRLPRSESKEMVFLTRGEYQLLRAAFSDFYCPFVDFLVASGCRFSEATALEPSDVDRDNETIRITRAWKRAGSGYEIGPPKTRRSVRTINVPGLVLDRLDYTKEWLFTSSNGGPVRIYSWRANVWYKSLAKATASGLSKRPRIHDLRHTCASWMIQAGVPLPVVQAHLGHESISTTIANYSHLDRRSHELAAIAVGKMLE
jgi:integrase